MRKIISAICLLFLITFASASSCPNPTPIIPYAFLDNIFDKVFPLVTGQADLRTFFANPNMDTARTYLTSQSSYLITLWIFSGLSFTFFIICIIQKCCFNCCRSKKCGNKINYNTYSPSSVTCCVYLFMFMSFLLLGITIASFIITSDLIANLNDTTCDINTTFNYIFDGTPQGYTPAWSGADKFNTYAQNLSINFPNTMPVLNDVFQSTQYNQLTNNTNGTSTLYNSALSYTCPSIFAAASVGCPFSDLSSCANGSNIQIPIFSQNFCNPNVTSSSASLILNEQTLKTTVWRNSLINLQQQINQSITNPVSFSGLASETSTLSNSFQSFKPTLSQAINSVNASFDQTKLGSYIFYSSIIFIALISFLSACCIFCTRNFNCIKFVYILWVLFAFLAILFFLASSVLLFISFTTFGTCVSYDYYTTTTNAFTTFGSYNSNKGLQILNTCFNNNTNTNIFDAFSSTNLSTIQNMAKQYYSSLPPTSFTTVVNNITNTLSSYVLNPNTVQLVGATPSQNPQAALDTLNNFASNSSLCSVLGSKYAYNPLNCYPLLINQASPSATCILINSNNLAQANSTLNCTFSFSSFSSLLNFGDNVISLGLIYMNSAGLQNYENAYFNYYQGLTRLLNQNVQSLFESFVIPYQKLIDGSSCSFLTQALNSLVITSCNRDFPQLYSISILITAMASCFFFMMIISYFLTVRMQFYAFLNGDLTNYDEDAVDEQPTVTIQMADTTLQSNRKELLTQQSPRRTTRK